MRGKKLKEFLTSPTYLLRKYHHWKVEPRASFHIFGILITHWRSRAEAEVKSTNTDTKPSFSRMNSPRVCRTSTVFSYRDREAMLVLKTEEDAMNVEQGNLSVGVRAEPQP